MVVRALPRSPPLSPEKNQPFSKVGARAFLPRTRCVEECVNASLDRLAHSLVVDDEVEEEAVELAVPLEERGRRMGLFNRLFYLT